LPAFIKPKIIVAVDENHVNFCIFLYAVVVCLSVCLCVSVALRYCIKTAKRKIMQIMPHYRFATLVPCSVCLEGRSSGARPATQADDVVSKRSRHLCVNVVTSSRWRRRLNLLYFDPEVRALDPRRITGRHPVVVVRVLDSRMPTTNNVKSTPTS